MIIYLISVRFEFHLYFNSKIFLLVLSLIRIFHLSFIFVLFLFVLGFIYFLIVISSRFEFELL